MFFSKQFREAASLLIQELRSPVAVSKRANE